MGESLRFSDYDQVKIETDPLVEIQEHLGVIEHLLAQLIERGDQSAQVKKNLRQSIAQHLSALGLDDLKQLGDFKANYTFQLQERVRNPRIPRNFPEYENFKKQLDQIISQNPKEISVNWSNIMASEAAFFGQYDWTQLQGRSGIGIAQYTFGLSRILVDKVVYDMVFDSTDQITVTKHWRFENGRHRGLALKALGEDFVKQSGMDSYIQIAIAE